MCMCTRRALLVLAGGVLASADANSGEAAGSSDADRAFMAEAQRMRAVAIADRDQPFGAIIVRGGAIVGYGPSRVVVDRNPDAHAERVAIWDAQRRLGTEALSGAVMYSTSRPCPPCESAAARAKIERMYVGAAASDAGRPFDR
jgi:tRNA(adenine34) deaminase